MFVARKTVGLAVVLAVLPLAWGGSVCADEAIERTDPFVAPEGCWTCARGCPAGTRATRSRPVVGDLVDAWSFKPKIKYEHTGVVWPPLVWGQRVWATFRTGKRRFEIHVLNLHDGSPLAKPRVIRSDKNPQPSIWNNRIVFRRGPNELRVCGLRDGNLRDVWSIQCDKEFELPLLYGQAVYVREDGCLSFYELPKHEPTWRGSPTHGAFAVTDQGAFALGYSVDGRDVDLLAHPVGGCVVARSEEARVYLPSFASEVVGLRSALVAHFGHVGVRSTDGRLINGAVVGPTCWERARKRGTLSRCVGMVSFVGPPVDTPAGPMAVVNGTESALLALTDTETEPIFRELQPLASGKHHPEFAPSIPLMSVAQDVVYVGPRAFRTGDNKIVWEGSFELRFAPVPANQRLLVVHRNGTLHALANEDAAERPGTTFGPTTAPREVEDGFVIQASGETHHGGYTFHPDDGHVEIDEGKHTKHVPREALRLLLDDEGTVAFAESIDDLPVALLEHVQQDEVDELREIAKKYYEANAPEPLARLIVECERLGLADKSIKLLRKMHAGLLRRQPEIAEEAYEAIRADEAELRSRQVGRVTRALVPLLEDERPKSRLLALRQLLTVDPDSKPGLDALRSWLPEFLRQQMDADPPAWVDVAVALRGRGIRPVDGGSAGFARRALQELRSALKRSDVSGLESDRLLIVTPLEHPRAIARCIVMGELVCDALREVFGVEPGKDLVGEPMVMQLFQDRNAYLKVATDGQPSGVLAKSTGHYDPAKRLSRIFLPEGDDAWARAMTTYAHELTHQWVSGRCPRFSPAEIRRGVDQPGFWIVEGVAELLAEFEWNVELRTWRASSHRSKSLDIVANLSPGLIPWSRFFDLTQRHLGALSGTELISIPTRWTLGMSANLTGGNIFYAQAGAACQYLFHSGEAGREALRQYVELHYTGKLRADSFKRIFGMTPEELGKRIVAFATESQK